MLPLEDLIHKELTFYIFYKSQFLLSVEVTTELSHPLYRRPIALSSCVETLTINIFDLFLQGVRIIFVFCHKIIVSEGTGRA